MKHARELVTSTVIGGVFIVVPVYLAVLLLLKGMKSAASWYGRSPCCSPTGCRPSSSSRWWWCWSPVSSSVQRSALRPDRSLAKRSRGCFSSGYRVRAPAQPDAAIGGRR